MAGGKSTSYPEKARRFHALHRQGELLVLPNCWDVASAILLARAGFAAVATSSAGIGYAFGYPVGQKMPREEMLFILKRMASWLAVPLSADMEAGYGDTPEEVAETARLTAEAGCVGINIEDRTYRREQPFFAIDEAAARVAAACAAAAPFEMLVNARTDLYWLGGSGEAVFAEAVARAKAFCDAGAHCIFIPGVKDPELIRRLVQAIPAPLNILAGVGSPDIATLKSLGVARVTFGASMARAAYASLEQAAKEIASHGTYGYMAAAAAHADMNQLLSGQAYGKGS